MTINAARMTSSIRPEGNAAVQKAFEELIVCLVPSIRAITTIFNPRPP